MAPKRATFDKSVINPPRVEFEPGAVARSILISMFALNPRLRGRHPDIAQALIDASPIFKMPSRAAFYLALSRGTKAQVAGYRQIKTHLAGQPIALESLAQRREFLASV